MNIDIGIVTALAVIVVFLIALGYDMLNEPEEANRNVLPRYARVFMRLSSRFFATDLVKSILRAMGINERGRWGTYMREKRDSAGLYELDPMDIMALQVVVAGVLYGLFVLILWRPSGQTDAVSMVSQSGRNLIACLPMILIGAYYPILLLNRHAAERKEAMFSELPYVLDLLSLGIEAGLDFRASVERLVNFSEPTPLMNELRALLNDLQLGTPMDQALLKMRSRIDILAFFTFIEALIQATQIGIDVSSTLRAQAEQMRVTYFQNVEKKANTIPIAILLPSVVFIFPPLLFLTLGPIVLQLMNHPVFGAVAHSK
jgi:hypothetical protein